MGCWVVGLSVETLTTAMKTLTTAGGTLATARAVLLVDWSPFNPLPGLKENR